MVYFNLCIVLLGFCVASAYSQAIDPVLFVDYGPYPAYVLFGLSAIYLFSDRFRFTPPH